MVKSMLSKTNVQRFNEDVGDNHNPALKSGIKSTVSSKMVSINVGQGKQNIAMSHLNKKKNDTLGKSPSVNYNNKTVR